MSFRSDFEAADEESLTLVIFQPFQWTLPSPTSPNSPRPRNWQHHTCMPRSKASRKAKQAVDRLTSSLFGKGEAPKVSRGLYSFPFLQYTSLAGSHVVLLSFAALALPSSSKWLGFKPIPLESSLDRPQHPFMEPITANPTATVVTVSLGLFATIVWWSGWVRLWWALENKQQRPDDKQKRIQSKLNVRLGPFVLRQWHEFAHDYTYGDSLDLYFVQAARNAVLSTLAAAGAYHAVLILFGAYSTRFALFLASLLVRILPPLGLTMTFRNGHSYPQQTLALALLLSVLTVFTPVYTLELPYFSLLGYKSTNEAPDESAALVHKLTWIRLFSELR